jgi:putative nucleotidyltransferase with HDIG domain
VLARAVDAKDPSTRQHSERVSEVAKVLAGALGWTADDASALRDAGLVHDVGKIAVPDAILFKPDRLTSEEFRRVRAHAALGAEIVADVLSGAQVAWVRGHHERWDGAGYPDGLAGEGIPEGARILTLADAWDVMTSARPYGVPLSREDALTECRRCSGAQFWPEAVEALERLVADGLLPGERPSTT